MMQRLREQSAQSLWGRRVGRAGTRTFRGGSGGLRRADQMPLCHGLGVHASNAAQLGEEGGLVGGGDGGEEEQFLI